MFYFLLLMNIEIVKAAFILYPPSAMTKIENLVKTQSNYVIMWCKLGLFADSFCCTDQLPVISVALQQLGVYTCFQMHAVYVQTVSQLYHGSDSICVPLSNFTCTPTFATEEGSRK